MKLRNWLLLSLLVLVLVFSGCRTVETKTDITLPSFDAYRPTDAPVGLFATPKTDVQLLKNSVIWEYWAYDWQDYALSLEKFKHDAEALLDPG